jgi:carbon-monoxide dehydrogenase large subunit
MPHARITRVDTTRARTLPGVVAVFDASDLAETVNPIVNDAAIPGMRKLTHTALASDRVRLVGDPIAMVVAESRAVAEDAVELIEVEYDPLPPVPDLETALNPSSTPLYAEAADNVAYHDSISHGNVTKAFAAADRVITRTLRQHRCMPAPVETRGGVAAYETAGGELTYHVSMHAPHLMRQVLGTQLGIPLHRIRVIAPDMGGSFGSKWGVTREDLLVCAAAVRTGRPVRWVEDRRENLMTGGHARDETLTLHAAVRDDGTVLGLRAELVLDAGAYWVTPMNPAFFTLATRLLLPGPYRIPAYRFETTTVLTNKGPYVAYRGPWAVETWGREVLLDIIANELGLSPAEVRLKNLVTAAEQPYRTAAGYTLKGVTARETLERALSLIDLPDFRERQRHAEGRLIGFGLATFIEPAPGGAEFLAMLGGARETARVRIEPSGQVMVFTSQVPHGQGHETTLSQVVATELSVPLDHVKVVHGDTLTTPFSMAGTGGSRSATFATHAALRAARAVKRQVYEVAGGMLGASADDLELADTKVCLRGAPQTCVPLERVAGMVYLAPAFLPAAAPAELGAEATFDGGDGRELGFSQATHCCWVEIDPTTGKVRITRYLVVEDCGTMINPAVVEGQIRGGTAQGIGEVLFEQVAYGPDGGLLTPTLRDYLLPGPADIPEIEIVHLSPERPGTFLGVAEGGAICAPPAITNAIANALGCEVTQKSASPAFILDLLERRPTPTMPARTSHGSGQPVP